MIQGFLGRGSFEGIDFEQPPHEVQEVLVIALQALLERSFLGHQNVDLQVFVVLSRLGFLLALALTFTISSSLLIDQALASKEVRNQSSFLHHVLGDGTDDADYS